MAPWRVPQELACRLWGNQESQGLSSRRRPCRVGLASHPDYRNCFFGNRDYDIAEDDERLLIIAPESDPEPIAAPQLQINVVLNWLDELRERVPIEQRTSQRFHIHDLEFRG
jgi:hypothetical protein